MTNVGDRNYSAWIDKMPGSQNPIVVLGKITVPTAGWRAELVEVLPPGINPTILILELRLHAPAGPVPQVVTTIEARFRKPEGQQYKQVKIQEGAAAQTIDVGEVH